MTMKIKISYLRGFKERNLGYRIRFTIHQGLLFGDWMSLRYSYLFDIGLRKVGVLSLLGRVRRIPVYDK